MMLTDPSEHQHTDSRLSALHTWLTQTLATDFTLSPASSDASFRRYFRVESGAESWIVMDAPPERESVHDFVRIAQFLFHQGLPVPELFDSAPALGFLRMTDFGSKDLHQCLGLESVDALYQQAITQMLSMQQIELQHLDLPLYDANKLTQEMQLFCQWYLECHLGISPPSWLDACFAELAESALAQPTVWVHRDYHSRNLMVRADGALGILDFQDALIGPITYDLVSLLKDCYVELPPAQRQHWVLSTYQQQQKLGLISQSVSAETYTRWFDWMGLQRHLKVLGIFSRLHHRDHKSRYLNDLPLTLKYVLEVTGRYSAFSKLNRFLRDLPDAGLA